MSPPQPFEELFDSRNSRFAVNAFHSIADLIPQPVLSFNADGRCDYCNRRWIDYNGSGWNDAIGRDWGEFIHPKDLHSALSRWTTAKKRRASFEVECRLRSRTGNYRWFFVRAVPLLGSNNTLRWFATLTDIHEQKEPPAALSQTSADANTSFIDYNEVIEQQVASRTQRLRETITQLEAFAYSLAHDMRAPCRALTNYSQILLRDYAGDLTGEPQCYLHRISDAAERLDSFIRDLLVYSRVAHDRMPLNEIDVEQVLSDVIASLPSLQPPLARLVIDTPLNRVLGNDMLLAQCLTNLLTNACKFVKKDEKPVIRIYDEKCGRMIRISVADNGIGIPEEACERIFNVFERLNDEKHYPGTGVGLSIVRKAVERMQGKVGVVSRPGEGSIFWLELRAITETNQKGLP